jgi:ABC-type bacteriocin/lantibiotic exporter with double-glycine peptidase domain
MSTSAQLFGIVFIFMLLACLFYVIFGQVTVRKLRKNPETKNALGLEYVSGWDIINVAQALSLPRSWTRKLEKSPLSAIYASTDVLLAHTTVLDRTLGAIFYWLLMGAGLTGALLVLLNSLGYI